MTVVLETIDLTKRFAGIVATNNVSLKIAKGARHALIGPNGAGKTTLINLLTGVQLPTSGSILLEGEDIGSLPTHKRVQLGIVRTFQINQLFSDLTPLETIGLAVSERRGQGLDWWRIVGSRPDLVTEAVDILHAMAGANGIYDSYPIQRSFRDAHSLAGHISFSTDAQFSAWGLAALDGEIVSPTL